MSPSPPYRAACVAAVVIVPLLMSPLAGTASGLATGTSQVAATSEAPVRNTNGWARLSDPAVNVGTSVQAGLAQLADRTLVAAWREPGPSGEPDALVTTTVSPGNVAAAPTPQLSWSTLNPDPEVLHRPEGGAEVVFVGDDGSAGYFGLTSAYRLLVGADGMAAPPAEERYFAESAGIGVPFSAARGTDGATVVSQRRRWHVGLAQPSETADPVYQPAPWTMSDVGSTIATAGDTAYLAHFTTDTTVERGIYVGPLDAASDEPPVKLPGSWYVDQPVALEGSTAGVLWAAYCTGADACDRLVLRDLANDRSLTVPTGEYAARVALSPGPAGRMWVAWQSGSSAISAVRTNKAGTRFGPVRRSAPFYTVKSVDAVAVEGRTGPADVVVNGNGAVWHRRYLAPLTTAAGPTRWKVGKRQTVSFTVKDAGDAVPKAVVTLVGRSCTTGTTGTCSITVPARSKPATLTATVTRVTYEPATIALRVVS